MSKFDFTPDELAVKVKKLALLYGYQSPLPYLNELLDEVKKLEDWRFTMDFYLNMYHLFEQYADLFWNDSHKKEIIEWLKGSHIMTDLFDTTFNKPKPERPFNPDNQEDRVTIVERLIMGNTENTQELEYKWTTSRLEALQLTPKEAIECIEKSKSAFSPAMQERVLLPFLSKLAELDRLQRFEAAALQTKPKLTTPKKQTAKVKVSYLWNGNSEKELPELYNLLKSPKHELIASDTTFEQFEAIFTGRPIGSIKPIKWTGTNVLLAYFLDIVFKDQKWQSIADGGLFLNENGKLLNRDDLAQAKKKTKDYGKPRGYEMIDKILKTIQKHS
jgi:hypothetical protein